MFCTSAGRGRLPLHSEDNTVNCRTGSTQTTTTTATTTTAAAAEEEKVKVKTNGDQNHRQNMEPRENLSYVYNNLIIHNVVLHTIH